MMKSILLKKAISKFQKKKYYTISEWFYNPKSLEALR